MQIDTLTSTFYRIHVFKLKYLINLSKYQNKIYSKTRPTVKLNCESFKAKGRISKGVLQENKARQIFGKTNTSYPLICFVFL